MPVPSKGNLVMTSLLALTAAVLIAAEPARTESSRKPNPFAPSLPQLTDEEEAELDRIIDRFILFDTGKLKGEEGKKALADFQKLGPEATFALIRGLNRAAAIESSCPAVVIGKKLNTILRSTTDAELLEFARENIGIGVEQSRHMGVIKDLRAIAIFRKRDVQNRTATVRANPNPPATVIKSSKVMSNAELAKAVENTSGSQLRPLLIELSKRSGEEVIDGLAFATLSLETDTKQLASDLLGSYLAKQTPALLKDKLKDGRATVRAHAARAIGSKGVRYGGDVIDLLKDDDADVRQAAHETLVKLSKGTDFGPEADAAEADRDQAIRKWRDWLSKQR